MSVLARRNRTTAIRSVYYLNDRDIIRTGATADLAIFDLRRLKDVADYHAPHRLAEGMVYVLVNGVLAVDSGQFTNARSGKVLSLAR